MNHRIAFSTAAERRLLAQHAAPENRPTPPEGAGETPRDIESGVQEALKYVNQFYASPGYQNVYQQYGSQGVDASMYMFMQQQGMSGYPGMQQGNQQYPHMYYGQYGQQANPYAQYMPPYYNGMPQSDPSNSPFIPGGRRVPQRPRRPGSSSQSGPPSNPYAPYGGPPSNPYAPPYGPPPGAPEVTPGGVLASTEILNATSLVAVKLPGTGGVQQSVYVNSRTLSVEPANGNALLAAAGVRVRPTRFGDIHTFRFEFTRPGLFSVGWKDQMERNPYQWQDITVSGSASPGVTPPGAMPRGPDVAPGAGYNRVEYSETARSFIQTRLDWVRTTAEDPNSVYRQMANDYDSSVRTRLDASIDRTSDGVTLKRVNPPEHGRRYAIEVNHGGTTERWYVAAAVTNHVMEQNIVFQNASDMLMQAAGLTRTFLASPGLNGSAIKEALQVARKRRASETNDAANVRNFDLPRGESILYTGVFDQTDPTEENHARNFGSFLGSRGYNMVGGGNDTFAAGRDLLGTLESRFDAAYRAGIKNHYLYFSVHGDTTSVGFGIPGGGRIDLEPSQLMNLFKKSKYNDCRFVLRMNCCNSGGFQSGRMAEQFRAAGESGRISVFIQTKPELPNPIRTTDSRTRNPDGSRSRNFDTPYDYYLVHFLNQGMTYGQAHVAADEATKRAWPGLDAGVFRTTPTGGVETASFRPDGLSAGSDVV